MRKIIYNTKAPIPRGAYSQGVVAGKFIFVSGQLPMNPENNEIAPLNIKEQTRQVFKNITQVLATEEATIDDIVMINAFLLKREDFKGMDEIFQEVFPNNPPTRTTITVKDFPPNVLVEINAIAVKN